MKRREIVIFFLVFSPPHLSLCELQGRVMRGEHRRRACKADAITCHAELITLAYIISKHRTTRLQTCSVSCSEQKSSPGTDASSCVGLHKHICTRTNRLNALYEQVRLRANIHWHNQGGTSGWAYSFAHRCVGSAASHSCTVIQWALQNHPKWAQLHHKNSDKGVLALVIKFEGLLHHSYPMRIPGKLTCFLNVFLCFPSSASGRGFFYLFFFASLKDSGSVPAGFHANFKIILIKEAWEVCCVEIFGKTTNSSAIYLVKLLSR